MTLIAFNCRTLDFNKSLSKLSIHIYQFGSYHQIVTTNLVAMDSHNNQFGCYELVITTTFSNFRKLPEFQSLIASSELKSLRLLSNWTLDSWAGIRLRGDECHLRVVSDEAFLLDSHSLSLRLSHDWSGCLLAVRLLLGGFAFGAGIAMFPDQGLRAMLPRLCVRGGRVRFIPRCSVWKSSVLRYGFNSSQS